MSAAGEAELFGPDTNSMVSNLSCDLNVILGDTNISPLSANDTKNGNRLTESFSYASQVISKLCQTQLSAQAGTKNRERNRLSPIILITSKADLIEAKLSAVNPHDEKSPKCVEDIAILQVETLAKVYIFFHNEWAFHNMFHSLICDFLLITFRVLIHGYVPESHQEVLIAQMYLLFS